MKSKKHSCLIQINQWNAKNFDNLDVAVLDANVLIERYSLDKLKEHSLLLMPHETIIESGTINNDILPITSKLNKKDLSEVHEFYNSSTNRTKLEKITELKVHDTISEFDKEHVEVAKRMLLKREQGYLPEEGDQKLLAYCLMLKKALHCHLSIISKDRDFRFFSKELENNYGISVINPENTLEI